MDKKEKTGVLNVRDLVNVGLFSVLIFIATFLSGMIGFIPVLMPVVPFVYGIVSGPVYMLYFTKIKKAGMLFIQTIVVTLAFVATGHGAWVLLTAVIGGLLGEVVLSMQDLLSAYSPYMDLETGFRFILREMPISGRCLIWGTGKNIHKK